MRRRRWNVCCSKIGMTPILERFWTIGRIAIAIHRVRETNRGCAVDERVSEPLQRIARVIFRQLQDKPVAGDAHNLYSHNYDYQKYDHIETIFTARPKGSARRTRAAAKV
jgi:hypothetical protein